MLERPLAVPAESNSERELVVEQTIVRGNTAKGQRPYVCIDRVKYTNESLASMPEAIGHKLIVQIDARDMRTVRGHLESGEDVGILTASKAWWGHGHSRIVRRAINSILARRALEIPKSDDPIEVFGLHKREQLAK
jgi:putative transposase